MEKPSGGDRYRSHLVGEGEKDTHWRHGSPPSYDLVNKLFEQDRTKEWPKGSLEDTVQNAVKTWEMELSHKTRLRDFKSINLEKFKFSVNGRKGLSGEETLRLGSYNALLQSSLPEELRYYKADEETFESSHEVFQTTFPGGFAWEVLEVYSGPPKIAFKFRHWAYMEGPYKGHAPTGELVEFYGVAVMEATKQPLKEGVDTIDSGEVPFRKSSKPRVDDQLRAEEVEIYYDPGELFAGLLKGPLLPSDGQPPKPISVDETLAANPTTATSSSGPTGCPFIQGT